MRLRLFLRLQGGTKHTLISTGHDVQFMYVGGSPLGLQMRRWRRPPPWLRRASPLQFFHHQCQEIRTDNRVKCCAAADSCRRRKNAVTSGAALGHGEPLVQVGTGHRRHGESIRRTGFCRATGLVLVEVRASEMRCGCRGRPCTIYRQASVE